MVVPLSGTFFSTEEFSRVAKRKDVYQKLICDYLLCAATVDDNIGKLLAALDGMGIAYNTIVVYVADQGYFFTEYGFYNKRMYYEKAARMPFVICYPKLIPAGKHVKELIMNVDFVATLSDFAGVKTLKGVQGKSFKQILTGEAPKDWRKTIYYRYWTQHDIRPVRNDRYKLMFLYGDCLNMTGFSDYKSKPSWEFYDLQKEPKENHNAYNDKEDQLVITDMKKEMLRLHEEVGNTDSGSVRMKEILKQEGLVK